MRKKNLIVLIIAVCTFMIFGVAACEKTEAPGSIDSTATVKNITESESEKEAENTEMPKEEMKSEPLVTNIFTADPSAHVFEGKLYIYPSHDPDELIDPTASDNDGGHYQMVDYHVLSMDSIKGECIDNGAALKLEDIPWASKQLWAPDAAHKNGKYYLFFPAKDKDDIFRIGVAVSDSPAGPFDAEDNYIEGSFSIDPAVLVDDDDKAYIIFGGIWGGQLEHWQTGEYVDDPKVPASDEPALGPIMAQLSDDMLSFASEPFEVSIVDKDGNPLLAKDEDRRFFEAAWLHKYNGMYYLSYSTGTTHYIVYATSDTVEGPYTYQGRILNPVLGWTTHHSIVEFEGKWYLFYHDASLSGGQDNKRSVKVVELEYNDDGTIKTINP